MRPALIAALVLSISASPAVLGDDLYDCEMDFELKGWSAFYKKARGKGTVTCGNGQSAGRRGSAPSGCGWKARDAATLES